MKKLLLTTTLLASFAVPAMAEGVSGNLTFTTDYVFRGVSQTDEAAAIQGGFDYEHGNGLHAGVWGSNVDFNDTRDGSMELDIYAGFGNEVGAFSYDVGGIYYMYPGAESELDYDFWEAYVSAGYDFDAFAVSASINYSPEFFGDTGDAVYYAAGVDVPLPHVSLIIFSWGNKKHDESFCKTTNLKKTTNVDDWTGGIQYLANVGFWCMAKYSGWYYCLRKKDPCDYRGKKR